eukprot:12792807-Alexandrium_andersonii.AAC.1
MSALLPTALWKTSCGASRAMGVGRAGRGLLGFGRARRELKLLRWPSSSCMKVASSCGVTVRMSVGPLLGTAPSREGLGFHGGSSPTEI